MSHPMAFSPGNDKTLVTHDFPLRQDMVVRMTLPVGFNTDDLERLIGFLRSLAFDPPSKAEEAPRAGSSRLTSGDTP